MAQIVPVAQRKLVVFQTTAERGGALLCERRLISFSRGLQNRLVRRRRRFSRLTWFPLVHLITLRGICHGWGTDRHR